MIDPNLIGPTTLALSQAIGAFNAFLPDITEIRKHTPDNDPEFAADVRMGEVAAVALTIGVGTVLSSLTGSSAPVTVGLLVAIGLVALYEYTLRQNKPMEVTA